jgi:15-cis-phytoene synthase
MSAAARATMAAGSTSFALASRLLPARARDHAAIVYAWCRRADDAIDLAPPDQRAAALARLGAELDAIYRDGAAGDPVARAFAAVVRDRRIPRHYPAELLAGMKMDVDGHRYATLDDLLHYGFRVAGTVGLMMCHVLGVSDEAALEHAAHLGMAMQLTNVCRDVHEDWQLERLYVPDEILHDCRLGALRDALGTRFPPSAREPMKRAVARLLAEAARYYASGDRGLPALPWRAALAVRSARLVYAAIGDRLEAQGCDVLGGRAWVPVRTKARLLTRAFGAAIAEVPARLARAGARPRIPVSEVRFTRDVRAIPAAVEGLPAREPR